MSAVEALYIFDEHNTPLLEHTYAGRPPSGSTVLPLYLAHPSPRPSLIYLPDTNPPTLLYSIIQDHLLFLSPCSKDTEPLQVLELLHRVADALEDFLGSPLLASKIEGHYDVVAQLLSEMVDGGIIACTEPNALRDVVEAPSFMKNLLGGVGLPSSTPSSLTPSATPFSLSSRPSPRLSPTPVSQSPSPVPWRRANVRHTSNELYVDIVETLHIISSPSGRPLSAISNGSIAFTAKVSGIPDLLLQIGCSGGVLNTVSLPVFHPCVRLNRWKERPGDLSFVPPDGRFLLCGYEVDLLGPAALDSFSTSKNAKSAPKLNVPATVSIQTCLGSSGADFEVRLQLNPRFSGKSSSPLPNSTGSSFSGRGGLGRGIGGASQGTTAAPTIEELVVHIPLPASVKNVADLRVAKGPGDAGYAPGDRSIVWQINSREVATLMSTDRGGGIGATATLRGTVVGQADDDALDGGPVSLSSNTYDYDDGTSLSYQSPSDHAAQATDTTATNAKRIKQNKVLMPSCATVSFSVKGWLASGIRVDSLAVDQKRSKGLGAGITPYKGVKYLCVSRKGVESRC
ncbi:Adaptor complexes medium subunit family-domain-containing protein [Massariosphaeria phaeospora]|uniref:Adaptor complexes medium subunit family-domain-containing protein n=1 Tax=Massariosphaeria phaeospora TaxID=100035 RepID=A0A7C8MEA9_9PLEO|nr:Adaptor complexes medium subunit family-domain-containing protein [Massariosphaeria phaeospora]